MPTTRKQTPTQARKSALESDLTPFYAVAGLTDAAVASLRSTLAETQEKANQRVAVLKAKPAQQADDLAKRISSLPDQLKAVPDTLKAFPEHTLARIADAQKQAEVRVAEANAAYADLAGRGKRAVDDAIVTARKLSTKAERRAEDLKDDLVDAVDPAFEKVQETVISARKATTGRTATETTTPRSAAKASATRKAATPRATTTKTSPAKSTATKPTATKSTGAKSTATKSTATKAAPRKTTAKAASAS